MREYFFEVWSNAAMKYGNGGDFGGPDTFVAAKALFVELPSISGYFVGYFLIFRLIGLIK
jgi:hypothetical protein